ncbi:hypothetical protein [Methanobrevibacter sp.]|uniref:hypothetical protein n=1 Tax=Methanobrevibacter sp. TaxID=66852 RepID=UPI00388E8821
MLLSNFEKFAIMVGDLVDNGSYKPLFYELSEDEKRTIALCAKEVKADKEDAYSLMQPCNADTILKNWFLIFMGKNSIKITTKKYHKQYWGCNIYCWEYGKSSNGCSWKRTVWRTSQGLDYDEWELRS